MFATFIMQIYIPDGWFFIKFDESVEKYLFFPKRKVFTSSYIYICGKKYIFPDTQRQLFSQTNFPRKLFVLEKKTRLSTGKRDTFLPQWTVAHYSRVNFGKKWLFLPVNKYLFCLQDLQELLFLKFLYVPYRTIKIEKLCNFITVHEMLWFFFIGTSY